MPRPLSFPPTFLSLAFIVLTLLPAGRSGMAAERQVLPTCAKFELLSAAQKHSTTDLLAAVGMRNWADASYAAQQLRTVEEPHSSFWFAWLILEGHMRGDQKDAVARLQRVADHGCPMAQSALSVLHAAGKGVPLDWPLAYKWAALAATAGDEGGKKLRDDIARLHPEAVAEGKRLAADFKPAAW